jgi:hypothetical protein
MTAQPHPMMLMIATMAAAWLMTQAGLAKKALEFRRTRRPCPSCGRQVHMCRCTRDAAGD